MYSHLKTGASIAASWAWGTSLIVGMQIAQQKGLGAWGIWAGANTLTLALFGYLTRCGLLGRHVFDRRGIKLMALAIQCLCLVIQMNIIFMVLKDMGMGENVAYLSAVAVGWVFTLAMYRHGLSTSIWTDCWQWGMTMLAIVVIIGMGLWQDVPRIAFPESSSSDILWGVWSACILLSGPIGDVQHWQRAEVTGRGTAFYWGSFFFGLYMLLVLVMAHFQFTTSRGALRDKLHHRFHCRGHARNQRQEGRNRCRASDLLLLGSVRSCRHHRAVEQGGRGPRGVRAADSRDGMERIPTDS